MFGRVIVEEDKGLLQICQQIIAIKYTDIPAVIMTKAQAQILSCLAAVYEGLSKKHPVVNWNPQINSERPFPYDSGISLEHNILELAQLVSLLDYDEIVLGGHLSQSAVLIPLLYGYQRSMAGTEILRAVVLTNELAGRISMTCALGKHRGQTAIYVHQCAAVIAKALVLNLDAEQMAAALSLALSFITKIDGDQFFNSDLKLLSATVPLQQGMYCVDQACKGLRCTINFSNRRPRWSRNYALMANAGVFDDLHKFWYTNGLSIKRYPACAYMCAAIEAAQRLKAQYQLNLEDIAHITVQANLLQYLCDIKTKKLLLHSVPHHTAVAFSTPLCLAAVFMPHLNQTLSALKMYWPQVSVFIRMVSVHWDRRSALNSLLSDMPVGMALARQPKLLAHIFLHLSLYKALGWWRYWLHFPRALRLSWDYQQKSREKNSPPLCDKTLGATVVIKTRNGRTLRQCCPTQYGFSQPDLSAKQLLAIALEKFNNSRPESIAAATFADQSQHIIMLTQSRSNLISPDHEFVRK